MAVISPFQILTVWYNVRELGVIFLKKWLMPITFVCILTGFFLAAQLKMQTGNVFINLLSEKNTNLITIITDLEEEIKFLEDQVTLIRQELGNLQNQRSEGQLKELQAQLKASQMAAGLVPVKGMGIIITLDDNNEGLKANPTDDPNKYIIHYESILNIISELKAAGAEAIDVNGQRIITTSEIRCVGNVILVNTTRLAPPFVIQAIGSPKLLYEMIANREVEILRSSQYPVSVKEADEIIIPAYKGDLQFDLSRTIKEG